MSGTASIFESLNEAQRLAAETTEGPVEVIAGAGTGKTRALVARYCHLVKNLGIPPASILCATFTNRAANEMKKRVRAEVGDLDLGRISTIHAFCVQFLRDEIDALGFPKDFVILDVDDERDILVKVFAEMGLSLRDWTVQEAIDEVLEAFKFRADSYVEDLASASDELVRKRAGERKEELFARYLFEQKKAYALDFNDLINFTSFILRKFPDVRERWQRKIEYVMMDEFQDVSKRQYDIAEYLSGRTKNLFIVGDPDQTIYTWRGSHVKLMLDFPKKHKGTTLIKLSENHRSTPEILAAANALIRNNEERFENPLVSVRKPGAKPTFHHSRSDKDEAAFVIGRIASKIKDGADPRDFAVLYRAHHLSRPLEDELVKARIPYRVFGGTPFYRRAEIRDAVAYMRMLGRADDWSFRRTVNMPPRKFGKKKLASLEAMAKSAGTSLYETLRANIDHPAWKGSTVARYIEALDSVRSLSAEEVRFDDRVKRLLDACGYDEWLRLQNDQERLDNFAELMRAVQAAAEDPDTTLEDFVAAAALAADKEAEGSEKPVTLMTVHAAKGMEFRDVTVCGLDEGVFPSRRSVTPEDLEEERRLAYVAVTRAKDTLTLTDSEGAVSEGTFKYPSRFIFEMEEFVEFDEPLDDALRSAALRLAGQRSANRPFWRELYGVGARVTHQFFGEGTVESVDESEGAYTIKFDKLSSTRRVAFSAFSSPQS